MRPIALTFLHRGNPGISSSYDVVPLSYDAEQTRFGVRYTVKKRFPSGNEFTRVTNFVFPFIGCVEVGYPDGFQVIYQTPADDYHTTRYNLRFRKSQPLSEEEMRKLSEEVRDDYMLVQNKHNGYLIDRKEAEKRQFHRRGGFCDSGRLHDRKHGRDAGPETREHLGVGDRCVVTLRIALLKTVKQFQNGAEPPGLVWKSEEGSFSDIYCLDTNRHVKAAS